MSWRRRLHRKIWVKVFALEDFCMGFTVIGRRPLHKNWVYTITESLNHRALCTVLRDHDYSDGYLWNPSCIYCGKPEPRDLDE